MPAPHPTRRPLLLLSLPGPRAFALGCCLAFGLAGCAERIQPASSGLRLPVAFRASTGAVPTAMRWPDAAWWEGFASPELDRLMRAAMSGNLDIAAAVAQLQQADAQIRIAGSALLPTVEGDLSLARSRSTSRNAGSAAQAGNSFDGSLSAGYEVDFWGRNRALLQAARSSASSLPSAPRPGSMSRSRRAWSPSSAPRSRRCSRPSSRTASPSAP